MRTKTMRLIDADALIAQCEENAMDEWNKKVSPVSWAYAEEEFASRLYDAPTVDAVPVVRCKDCEFHDTAYTVTDEISKTTVWCCWWENVVGANRFCDYGKREDGEQNAAD